MWNRKLAPLAVAFFLGCNNYGLLEQLQNPGGGNSAQNIMMYAFVSSATMNGNLTGGGSLQSAFPPCSAFTGLQLADCACNQMAQNAGLAIPVNKYVAWLSTSTNDMTCRISNTTSPLINCTLPGGGPTWVNMSGQTVASGYAALLSGALQAPIGMTEQKTPSNSSVWTGTAMTGTAFGSGTCSDWVGSGSGQYGTAGQTSSIWTANSPISCSPTYPFYCFARP